jgi:hypothetical protein
MDELPTYLTVPADLSGCWIAEMASVNIEDLIRARPGAIVRVRHTEALKYIPPTWDDYERVAGMISDGA